MRLTKGGPDPETSRMGIATPRRPRPGVADRI